MMELDPDTWIRIGEFEIPPQKLFFWGQGSYADPGLKAHQRLEEIEMQGGWTKPAPTGETEVMKTRINYHVERSDPGVLQVLLRDSMMIDLWDDTGIRVQIDEGADGDAIRLAEAEMRSLMYAGQAEGFPVRFGSTGHPPWLAATEGQNTSVYAKGRGEFNISNSRISLPFTVWDEEKREVKDKNVSTSELMGDHPTFD